MMIMAREGGYAELLTKLDGVSVLIWTCNTCARLCNGLGGREAAERLAARLAADGVDVRGVMSTSASCLMSKAAVLRDAPEADVLLALTCDMGARCAGEVYGRTLLNPVVTFGPGYMAEDGSPRLCSVVCGRTVMDEGIEEAASRVGAEVGPYL